MLWPPPVSVADNSKWWDDFWSDCSHDGFGLPSDGLLEWIPHTKNRNNCAIDIASGNGRYAFELASLGYLTTALELSASGVEIIRKKSKQLQIPVKVERGDFIALSKEKRSYDVLLCSGLLEEVPLKFYPEIINGLANWASDGAVVINRYCLEICGRGVFAKNGYVPSLYKSDQWELLYSNELVRTKLSKGGFEIRHGTVITKRKF